MFFESFLLNVSVLGVLIVALIFDYVTKFFSYWYIRHISYKTPIPFFGTDYRRVIGIRNTSDEVKTLYTEYPKQNFVGCIKSRIPDLIVKDPDSIRKILSTDFSNFHCRGLGLDKSRDVCLRNNLFYAEGEKWTLLRGKFELLLNNMNYEIQDSLHDCLSGTNGDTNVQRLLADILDVVFKDLLIDNNVEGSVIRNVREKMQNRTVIERLKSYLKEIFPSVFLMFGLNVLPGQFFSKFTPCLQESKLLKDIKKVESISQEEINVNKKFNRESDMDLVQSYLALFIEEGYIPCHNVLIALLFELSKYPEVQEKVRTMNKTSANDYLDLVVKETLRMHPAYSVITRKCVKAYKFAQKDLLIDRGVTITIPVEAIQNDETNFKDANVFNPSRFDNNKDINNFAFIPFGVGPRKCIGEDLALHIVRCVASSILSRFHIESCDSTPKELPITDHSFKRVIERDIWLKFKPVS